jgi:hypothetical protein
MAIKSGPGGADGTYATYEQGEIEKTKGEPGGSPFALTE